MCNTDLKMQIEDLLVNKIFPNGTSIRLNTYIGYPIDNPKNKYSVRIFSLDDPYRRCFLLEKESKFLEVEKSQTPYIRGYLGDFVDSYVRAIYNELKSGNFVYEKENADELI